MRLTAAAVLLACAGLTAAAEPPKPPAYDEVRLSAEETPLNPDDPAQTQVGELTYAWGVRLRGVGTSRFGGLSGLEVQAIPPPVFDEGKPVRRTWRSFTAATDDGDVFRWTAGRDRPGPSLAAVLQRLADLKGKPVSGKEWSDAEGLAETEDGFLVSFERRHRVWAYGRLFRSAPEAAATPPTGELPPNRGFEAVARIPRKDGGDLLALGAEDGRLWLCEGAACRLALASAPGFGWWLTGLDHLPGTSDLVGLYRFYNPLTGGFRAMIAYIPVREGRALILPIARFADPLITANFEGVAVIQQPDGYRLYVVSDNGFAVSQPTYLLAFDWAGPGITTLTPALPGEGRGPER